MYLYRCKNIDGKEIDSWAQIINKNKDKLRSMRFWLFNWLKLSSFIIYYIFIAILEDHMIKFSDKNN